MAAPRLIDSSSFLLAIPTELRLQIYDYCLADTNSITITAAPLTVFGQPIRDTSRRDIPGLPREFSPLVRHCYDPALLSISDPASIELEGANALNFTRYDKLPYPAPLVLLQSCRTISEELGDYMKRRRPDKNTGGLSLYVTYPHGILVLKELYPFLLRQAKNLYISGYHSVDKETLSPGSSDMNPSVLAFIRQTEIDNTVARDTLTRLPPHSTQAAEAASHALSRMVSTVLSNKPGLLQKMEARVVYPGDTFSALWLTDSKGPVIPIMRNVCGGKIKLNMSRSRWGNAVHIVARPNPGTRIVSSVWDRERLDHEEFEGFVIGPDWPEEEA